MNTHLVWFRHDLRVLDHQALSAACRDPDARVIALFIATPQQWQQHDMAPRQAEFLFRHVQFLQTNLQALGIPLYCTEVADFAASVAWIVQFCQQQHVDALFYHRQYEWNEHQRDICIERELENRVSCYSFDDSVLLPPGSVCTGKGEMFKVFTPFRRAFLQRLLQHPVVCLPRPSVRDSSMLDFPEREFNFTYPREPVDETLFPCGEQAALERLRYFCHQQVMTYGILRDSPADAATSMISPYLALGIISPRQCFNRLRLAEPMFLSTTENGAFIWLNELIWREFYRHLMVAYPKLSRSQPFLYWTNYLNWNENKDHLFAWQQGNTGYPLVDAGMRQLNTIGWMHNRLRMLTASFLVKDLLIDWREGERYFMSKLIDGDLAANNGGWQWAASTGTDAAPYFRIFNPTTQSERFDPKGIFIRQWLPELQAVPDEDIHQPWRWAKRHGIQLSYPMPIVEHAEARLRTLAAFEQAKSIS